jgi:hypothetical protein
VRTRAALAFVMAPGETHDPAIHVVVRIGGKQDVDAGLDAVSCLEHRVNLHPFPYAFMKARTAMPTT